MAYGQTNAIRQNFGAADFALYCPDVDGACNSMCVHFRPRTDYSSMFAHKGALLDMKARAECDGGECELHGYNITKR